MKLRETSVLRVRCCIVRGFLWARTPRLLLSGDFLLPQFTNPLSPSSIFPLWSDCGWPNNNLTNPRVRAIDDGATYRARAIGSHEQLWTTVTGLGLPLES